MPYEPGRPSKRRAEGRTGNYRMGRSRSVRKMSRTSRAAKSTSAITSTLRTLTRRILPIITGPTGQQLLSLALIALGIITILTVAGLNSGIIINTWARIMVYLFGWGAYLLAALITVLGLLWLNHLVHRPTRWRWRPFLGLQLTLIGLLTLTDAFMQHGTSWGLVISGRGGGLTGWALNFFFSRTLGSLITSFLMGLLVLLGIGMAFDVSLADLRAFGHRLVQAWSALRAPATSSVPISQPTTQVTGGVALSPLGRRRAVEEAPPAKAATTAQAESAKSVRTRATQRKEKETPPPTRDENLPPLKLLRAGKLAGMSDDEIRRKSRIIVNTLAQFGIPVEVTEVRPGPTVTQFGVSPGYISRGPEGEEQRKVRVSQIASLADDLALALAARSLRVEAPVPGRAVVGIEVPNQEVNTISLRAVLESKAFQKCSKPLCFAVGLDVAGDPVVADLSTMPHLLIAGTTGSGKSVFVKALAASLVMNNTPDRLQLVTIDPKLVELSHLNGLPHLLGPTVTDLENTIRVLRWVAHEMDERYKRFASAVARHLDDYNVKMTRRGEELLPHIVVLIDELADLMMAAPEETERTLTRIAQMARATGIHMIVATQRPSTDVVTGLIKANFPARVSFATTSNTDSRVIIDTPGAESLLGRGDMLFLPPDATAPRRVQGCYISDEELEAIIQYWQKVAGATPAKAPWTVISESQGPDMLRLEGEDEDADLLEQAIALAQKKGKISTSGLQRRLRISYPRAARLMEQMETMGVVGPQPSAGRKRRVILGGDE